MHLKISSAKWRPFCPEGDELTGFLREQNIGGCGGGNHTTHRMSVGFAWNGNGPLTHWGRVTHLCVGNLTTIGSDNGLSPDWRQAITWTNGGILLIGLLGTNFSEMLIEINTFSFNKIDLKMSSGKWRPFCLGLNVLARRWDKALRFRRPPPVGNEAYIRGISWVIYKPFISH